MNNDEFKRGNTPYLLSSIEFIVLRQHKNCIPPPHLINLLPSRIFQFSCLTLFCYFSTFLAVIQISFRQWCIRLTSQFLVPVLTVLSNMFDMLIFHFIGQKYNLSCSTSRRNSMARYLLDSQMRTNVPPA